MILKTEALSPALNKNSKICEKRITVITNYSDFLNGYFDPVNALNMYIHRDACTRNYAHSALCGAAQCYSNGARVTLSSIE